MGSSAILAGGQGEEVPQSDIWRFDVASNTYTELSVTLPVGLLDVGGARFSDGRVVVAGGQDGQGINADSVFVIDVDAGNIDTLAPLPRPMQPFLQLTSFGDTLWIIDPSDVVASILVYDPRFDIWLKPRIQSPKGGRAGRVGVVGVGGGIAIMSGDETQLACLVP